MKIKRRINSRNKNKFRIIGIAASLFLLSVFFGVKIFQTSDLNSNREVKSTSEISIKENEKKVLRIYPDDPAQGSEDAQVTIVEFADFQCPFSSIYAGFNEEGIKNFKKIDKTYRPAGPNIISDYLKSGKVRFVWKDYPFIGEESVWAAQAARCAGDQGKFWEYHDYLFSHQKGENKSAFVKDNLKQFARTLKLNTDEFDRCLDEGKYEQNIRGSLDSAKSIDVNGTPTTFINGRMIAGALNYDKFKIVIEEELKK